MASSLPEDGEAITRRALEAAKTCVAVKANPANYGEWLKAAQRFKRWESRASGEIPKNLQLNFADVKGVPIYSDLMAEIGQLSDFAVHFTPEYFWRYTWEETERPGGGSDFSFGLVPGAIELALLMLCRHHHIIIRAFDYCQDGNMLQNTSVALAIDKVAYLQNHFANLLKKNATELFGASDK